MKTKAFKLTLPFLMLLGTPCFAAGPLPACLSAAAMAAQSAAHEIYPTAELVSLNLYQTKPAIRYGVIFHESESDQLPIQYEVKLAKTCMVIEVRATNEPARLTSAFDDISALTDSGNHEHEQYCCTRTCVPSDHHVCRYIPSNEQCSPGARNCH